MTLSSVIAAVMSVQLLAVLEQRGVPLATAVALGAIIGPCQVGARLIDLLAGQRTHPVWEGVLSAVFVTLGLGLLLTRQDAVVPALVVYGGGIGLRSIVRGTLPLALFGPVGYPSLIGRLAFPMLLGQAAGPSAGRGAAGAFRRARRAGRAVLDGDRHAGVQRDAGAVRAPARRAAGAGRGGRIGVTQRSGAAVLQDVMLRSPP